MTNSGTHEPNPLIQPEKLGIQWGASMTYRDMTNVMAEKGIPDTHKNVADLVEACGISLR